MNTIVSTLFAAILANGLLGCATDARQAQVPRAAPATGEEILTISDKEHAHGLLVSADREIQNLRGMLERTVDPEARSAIEAQIKHISASRARLVADLTYSPSAFLKEGQFEVDASNLRRAIEAGAATEMQRSR